MSSAQTTPALAERGDIHKSCKSIETLLNTLSEYCEAAGALVSLQKKLARALKDAASSKATAEIASNVMLASASVFESLSDVDSKFSKTLDKEYDMISDEVKKSFKKLTKEEKVHDEKMSAANAKIKQAGQTYEKKAKKKSSDANEEHARYINLISTLGPELSQDKYNHAVGMSQRHTTMIYSVASCLARLADLEWQKSCECVRRFSPSIGPLGSLRSLCEGGWTGLIPPDLPDSDVPIPHAEANTRLGAIDEIAEHQLASTDVTSNSPPLNGFDSLPVNNQTWIPANPIPIPSLATISGDTLQPPTAPFVDPNTGSVRSLSAFPTPPSHFPLPPLRQQQQQQQPTSPITTRSSTSLLEFPSSSPLADSPISVHDDLSFRGTGHTQQSNSAQSSAPSPAEQNFDEQPEIPEANSDQAPTRETPTRRPLPRRSQTYLPPESPPHSNPHSPPLRTAETKPLNLRPHRDRESPTTREFAVLGHNNLPSPTKSRTMDNFKYPRSIERTDTGTSTTGSIVAAMRNRYDNNSGSISPPPRDLPRLPLHVNNMSGRYQSNESQRSPNMRTNSPPVSRQQSLPLLEASARQARDSYPANSSDEERRRQQREDELRDREVELEARARELERDRAQFQSLRTSREQQDTGHIRENVDGHGTQMPGQLGLHPQERRVSPRHQFQRPLSRMELDEVDEQQSSSLTRVPPTSRALPLRPRTQESYTQHLVPPPSTNNLHTPPTTLQSIHSPKPSHPPSPLLQSEGHLSNRSRDDVSRSHPSTSTSSVHAPFCGCENCSISKYREQPRNQQNSQNESRRSEKRFGTGWVRRLSIPSVSNMKHHSSNSIEVANNPNKGVGLFSLDSKRNMSATGLGADEDGKLGRPAGGMALGRRSYDFAGMNHRSMTNLNLR